jgi:hypothetical protein
MTALATAVVSGGVDILGVSIPVVAVIAFILGIVVGRKI